MINLKDKKAQEMTIGTIIVIILALLVLVLLILGFSMGWSNLWDKIKNLGPGGQANVDTIVQSCNIACTTGSQYEYCREREINFGKGAEPPWSTDSNRGDGKLNANCEILLQHGTAGLEACTIDCPESCKGVATACKDIPVANCDEQKGCKTSTDGKTCEDSPTATACSSLSLTDDEITNKVNCEKQKICSWQ